MINSINSGASMPPPPRTEQNLTSEQQSVISDTLSEFDVGNGKNQIISIYSRGHEEETYV